MLKPDKERLVAALRGERPDRVPNFEDILTAPVVSAILGTPCKASSRGLPIGEAMELARRTHQDAIVRVGDAWPRVEGRFCDWPDIQRWEQPDLAGFRQGLEADCEALAGTGIGIGLNLCGPLFTTYMEVGPVPIQSFLLKLYDDRAFIEALMDRQVAYQLAKLEAVMDLPIDFFLIADDTCDNTGFLCSPEMMAELWAPRVARLVTLAQQKSVPIQWHCCGKLDPVIRYLLEWGIDAVNPVQTRCNDIFALHERYGGRLAFRGNVNIEGPLAFGTAAEAAAEARMLIDRLGPAGGFILASSHSIIETIPPANYRAMIDTVLG